jgi:glutathione S-transferase
MVAVETARYVDELGEPLELVLYHKETCPYCVRVRRRARQLGIELDLRSTWKREHRERLIELGGKKQVPCLVVNGRPLYESADIIEFLETQVRLGE